MHRRTHAHPQLLALGVVRRAHVPPEVVHHAVDLAADGARCLPRMLLHVHLARVRIRVALATDGAGEPRRATCRKKGVMRGGTAKAKLAKGETGQTAKGRQTAP